MAYTNPLDYFSGHAADYAKYRPVYPDELIQYMKDLVPYRGVLWDAACGNGQMATGLSPYFQLVCASDISPQQIALAPADDNILYSVQSAENTDYPNAYFDMVVVSQALHWLDLLSFFREVKRVLRPGGIFAAIGYDLVTVNPPIDELLQHLYQHILGDYWPKERKIIESRYQNMPFPFEERPFPELFMRSNWSVERYVDYLNTWSGVKQYEIANQENPVARIHKELYNLWGNAPLQVSFPLFGRVGTL
jgi:SAM-dependent methyltransferase